MARALATGDRPPAADGPVPVAEDAGAVRLRVPALARPQGDAGVGGLEFVDRAENVILLGPPGVGKTHLAIALGIKAVDAGSLVLFLTLETLMSRLIRAR